MTDINEIAVQASEAFAKDIATGWEVMSRHYADVIDIHHVPPEPTDGPVASAAAAAYMQGTAVALGKLKDFSSSNGVQAEGQRITLRTAQHFLDVDGEPVTFHGELVYHFENGRVVRLVSTDEPATYPQLVQAIAAAGGIGPSPWRDRDEYPPVRAPAE
jgi:hypothetical protein